jgi:hypothetical protein
MTAQLTNQIGETLANVVKNLNLKWLSETYATLKAEVAFSLKTAFDSCAATGMKSIRKMYSMLLKILVSWHWRKCCVQFVQMHGWKGAGCKELLEKLQN